jgi:hypothetical protein
MSNEKNIIFFNNWWPGFNNRTDANHIGFFENLLNHTELKNYEIGNDFQKCNVLIEAGKTADGIKENHKWKHTINFIGEPTLPEADKYDVCLTSVNNIINVVDLPLSVAYIHCNHFLPNLLNRFTMTNIPPNFCSFIVSNPKCEIRNTIFQKLNQYKKVHSMGRHLNNVGGILYTPYWTQDYFNIIGSYKFMICCENTKMETYSTEKIVNPYLARTIPIYWGSANIKNIFNPESMLFLEDETEESMNKLIQQVIELDEDDEKYLEFVNRPIFLEENKRFWNEHYTLEKLGDNINKILYK